MQLAEKQELVRLLNLYQAELITANDANIREAQRIQPIIAQLAETWQRIGRLLESSGVGETELLAVLEYQGGTPNALGALQRKISGNCREQDTLPGYLTVYSANRLIAAADLLGCSIDYLLGRTDVREMATADVKNGGDDGTD